jgi:hypothetical protein
VSHMTYKIWMAAAASALVALNASPARAAAPGITGPAFFLTAQPTAINQPDGAAVYSWGYGCDPNHAPAGFAPAAITNASCGAHQIPGPTLIVTEGQPVSVTLTNGLPTAAGNTSILFPGFNVSTSCSAGTPVGAPGLLTCEATPGGTVTYTFTAGSPGTRAYYSGTQSDLQVEMGLYGAIIVLPANVPAACTTGLAASNLTAKAHWGEQDFRLAASAYDHPKTCYDREYLFQFSEMDVNIHRQALAQVTATIGCLATQITCRLEVPTEPYHPGYFLINGRSMPDDMDANYGAEYPNQPYNGNPHMHPGDQTLIRVIGQGRWQHPFHQHGNHVRILARDGNLILSSTDPNSLAGRLEFTTTTTPGQAFDGIFYWTGRGLNWDAYAHNPTSTDPNAKLSCTPDAYGYNTGFAASDKTYSGPVIAAPANSINYYEWCQDHNKPLQAAPFGDVPSGGPATLPDANIFANGAWYSGSPYLGQNATVRATGPNSSFQPANVQANPAGERGYAFMWHSHNEREITTNNLFPGGMFMMMLVDSREFVIDESN